MSECNEKDKLILFADGCLDNLETLRLQSHIDSCDKCRHELEQMKIYDDKLRDSFCDFFESHSVKLKVMNKISGQRPVALVTPPRREHNILWYLSGATIALLVLIAIVFQWKTTEKPLYRGSVFSVQLQALSSQASIDGSQFDFNNNFEPMKHQIISLSGDFRFTVDNGEQISVFEMSGISKFSLKEEFLEFEDAKADFKLISGKELSVIINNEAIIISSNSKYSSAVKTDVSVHETRIKSTLASETGEKTVKSVILKEEESGSSQDTTIESPVMIKSLTNSPQKIIESEKVSEPIYTPNPFGEEPLFLNEN